MSVWEALMVIAGGLFAGGGATFAWSRVPIWSRMPIPAFVEDFGQTLNRTDKVQPALLIVSIASAIGFAVTDDGAARVFAIIGAVGFAAVLAASLAVMVPLQRRITRDPGQEGIEEMRQRWFQGNLGRSILSILAFIATAVAASLS